MKETWATSATASPQAGGRSTVDLHLEIAGPRVRAGLEAALRAAISSGRLSPGTRLPSSRALAADLGVARNTVAEVYGQLTAEGWLAARHGSGTWVADQVAAPAVPEPAAAELARRARHDLRPGVPDLSAFPAAAWLAAARQALNSAPRRLLGYGDPRGVPALREALAGYLSRARGVAVTPERIVVCAGMAQGVELLAELLLASGARCLAVEAYGHSGHVRLAVRKGLRVTPMPVDEAGAVVAAAGEAGGVLLTPAHQFPIGVPLAPVRRRQVLSQAAAAGALVIEDDYDGEFRYDRQAVGALQALAPEQVVYAGTASKSLVPGLRLGWLVLPAGLVDAAVDIKRSAGWLSSSIEQLTLAEFIGSGRYDRQVRRTRLAYRRRRDQLVSELARRAPQVRVSGIAAGLHALVNLPAGQQEPEVVAAAAARGLAVQGLGSFWAPGVPGVGAPAEAAGMRHDPALVVGYATPPGHAYSAALARLSATLAD
jgi:GntR family transcriptional regulator / MocR family aminotransferase